MSHTAAAAGAAPHSATPPRVLVVGDVIDDVIVQPLGAVAHASDTPSRITPAPGGSAANQAVWLADAGVRARFAGRVGAADLARHLATFEAAGVDAHLTGDGDLPTGAIVVLVDPDGERTMFTDRGANLALCADDLPDELLDDVAWVHLSGYSLFDAGVRSAVLGLADRARHRGIPVGIDPSSTAFLAEVGAPAFLRWIAHLQLLTPNLDEGRMLTGADDPGEVVEALLTHVPLVALTMGQDGALVAARGHDPVHLGAPDVEVVDTTGAGDAFTGAFLAAWLDGAELTEAARRGVAAGSRAVTVPGARPVSRAPSRPGSSPSSRPGSSPSSRPGPS